MDHTQNFPLRESCLKQGIWHDQLQANTFGSRQAWVQALPSSVIYCVTLGFFSRSP